MAAGPTLKTARLLLRPPRLEDFGPWTAFAADEPVMRRLGAALLRQDRLSPPYHEAAIDVRGQSREAWRARR